MTDARGGGGGERGGHAGLWCGVVWCGVVVGGCDGDGD